MQCPPITEALPMGSICLWNGWFFLMPKKQGSRVGQKNMHLDASLEAKGRVNLQSVLQKV